MFVRPLVKCCSDKRKKWITTSYISALKYLYPSQVIPEYYALFGVKRNFSTNVYSVSIQSKDLITFSQLKSLYLKVSENEKISNNDGIVLLSNIGHLCVEATAAEKIEFAEKIFLSIDKKSSTAYKLLLDSYIQYQHSFNPSIFLSKMNTKELLPDDNIYANIFLGYCYQGDLNSAHMLLKKWKPSQNITNELIGGIGYGHCIKGDPEKANKALKHLLSLGPSFSWSSFNNILGGFVKIQQNKDFIDSLSTVIGLEKTFPISNHDIVDTLELCLKANCLNEIKNIIHDINIEDKNFIPLLANKLVYMENSDRVFKEIYLKFYKCQPSSKLIEEFLKPVIKELYHQTDIKKFVKKCSLIFDFLSERHKYDSIIDIVQILLNQCPENLVNFLKIIELPKKKFEEIPEEFQLAFNHFLSNSSSDEKLGIIKKYVDNDHNMYKYILENLIKGMLEKKITIINFEKLLKTCSRYHDSEDINKDLLNKTFSKISTADIESLVTIFDSALQNYKWIDLNSYFLKALLQAEFVLDQRHQRLLYDKVQSKFDKKSSVLSNLIFRYFLKNRTKTEIISFIKEINQLSFQFLFPISYIPEESLDAFVNSNGTLNQVSKSQIPNSKLIIYFSLLKAEKFEQSTALCKSLFFGQDSIADACEFMRSFNLSLEAMKRFCVDMKKVKTFPFHTSCEHFIKKLIQKGNFENLENFLQFMVEHRFNLSKRSRVLILTFLCKSNFKIPESLVSKNVLNVIHKISNDKVEEAVKAIESSNSILLPPSVLSEILCRADPKDFDSFSMRLQQKYPWFKPQLQASVLDKQLNLLLDKNEFEKAIKFINFNFSPRTTSNDFIWSTAVGKLANKLSESKKLHLLGNLPLDNMSQQTVAQIKAIQLYYEIKEGTIKQSFIDNESVFEKLVKISVKKSDLIVLKNVYNFVYNQKMKVEQSNYQEIFFLTLVRNSKDEFLCKDLISGANLPEDTVKKIVEKAFNTATSYKSLFQIKKLCDSLITKLKMEIEDDLMLCYMKNFLKFYEDLENTCEIAEELTKQFQRIPLHQCKDETISLYSQLRHNLEFNKLKNGRQRFLKLVT